ncbi:hypothetical protein PLESTB_001061800 [Pleodorina starrii]|uniref:RING-type E3 ubiquitin transferase n=1 Tax=Pleodorina starrii TaxID=330485 RepID=A0A9W6BQM4_9CHLO|nr:hypothetical protein PLESTB_001061800 [Pleodorina starrii]
MSPMCSGSGMGTDVATVLCRMMQYKHGIPYIAGGGSGPIHVYQVHCDAKAYSLEQCQPYNDLADGDALSAAAVANQCSSHSNDLGLVCTGTDDFDGDFLSLGASGSSSSSSSRATNYASLAGLATSSLLALTVVTTVIGSVVWYRQKRRQWERRHAELRDALNNAMLDSSESVNRDSANGAAPGARSGGGGGGAALLSRLPSIAYLRQRYPATAVAAAVEGEPPREASGTANAAVQSFPDGGKGGAAARHGAVDARTVAQHWIQLVRRDAAAVGGAAPAAQAGLCPRTFPEAALAAATDGFSPRRLIGRRGPSGEVYKGSISGVPVAVKRLDTATPAQLDAVAQTHTRVQHPHQVLTLGTCPDQRALVYELVPGGNLESVLLDSERPAGGWLTWQERVCIAAEAASALAALHACSPPIVHMDLKPSNVLLDEQRRVKLGDIGLTIALQTGPLPRRPSSTGAGAGAATCSTSEITEERVMAVRSASEYLDPEYVRTGMYGPQSDTYSFGLLLLRLLTSDPRPDVYDRVLKCVHDTANGAASSSASASATAPPPTAASAAGSLRGSGLLDPRAGEWPEEDARRFAELGLWCAEPIGSNRPQLECIVLPALLELRERAAAASAPPGGAGGSCAAGGAGAPPAAAPGTEPPPSRFLCPITLELMEDPVFAADGFTYERRAMRRWIRQAASSHRGRVLSPMTNLPLEHVHLTPNLGLRSEVATWLQQRRLLMVGLGMQQQQQQQQRSPAYPPSSAGQPRQQQQPPQEQQPQQQGPQPGVPRNASLGRNGSVSRRTSLSREQPQ